MNNALFVETWKKKYLDANDSLFPWFNSLPAHEQEKFTDELLETLDICGESGKLDELEFLIIRWRATAEAYLLGVTADGSELDWLDDPVSVAPPQ